MDDDAPEAEAKMRQVLGISGQTRPLPTDDQQRQARQAIRSQVAAKEYAERQLALAEKMIQDLQTKSHTVRRERAIAIGAAKTAQDAQAKAERSCRAAETALTNEKSAGETARREARDARVTIQDLRTKLATANQTVEALQAQLEQERQSRIAAEQALSAQATQEAETADEIGDVTSEPPPVKRKRGRPPGKRNASAPRQAHVADQEPVRWWTEGWKPRA